MEICDVQSRCVDVHGEMGYPLPSFPIPLSPSTLYSACRRGPRRGSRGTVPAHEILSDPHITIHAFLPRLQAWSPAVIPRHRACPWWCKAPRSTANTTLSRLTGGCWSGCRRRGCWDLHRHHLLLWLRLPPRTIPQLSLRRLRFRSGLGPP